MMPIHPFLFAAYIVVSLYANNAAQVPVGQMIRPLVFSLLLAAGLYWLFHRWSRDKQYAAYAASWTLLWLGLFGHLYQAVNLAFLVSAGRAASEWLTLAAWTLVMGLLGTRQAWKSIRNKKLVNEVLTAIAIGAAIVPLLTIASPLYQDRVSSQTVRDWMVSLPKVEAVSDTDLPDIYYVILDGYGRRDVLQEHYGFDNSEFIEGLTDRGFFVAEQSHSNYVQTSLSIASALNMEYVNFLANSGAEIRSPAYRMVDDSRLRGILEREGYKTVNISSPALFTQLADYDVFLSPGKSSLSQFERLLISTSAVAPLLRDGDLLLPGYHSHRGYTLFAFDQLPEAAKVPGPKFVFVHIVAPHPPFVFDALGNPIQPARTYLLNDASGFPGSKQEYIDGYINQVRFVNSRTLRAVDAILQNSDHPAIILLQGDHGPGAYTNLFDIEKSCHRERGSILNAYYFPDRQYGLLSSDITPVNTFRVILDQYFDAGLPLLENRTYFSYWDDPYNFVDVTDQLETPCQP